jgi:uncharacterized protein DUF6785/uncharacterized protein DUF6784
MTLRALLIGLLGAVLICGLGYLNDRVLELESITAGHLLPVLVVGSLILFLAGVNPFLFRFRRSLALRPQEVAFVLLILMVSCSIPARGLMEQFTPTLAMPSHWNRMNPGWERYDVMKYVPDGLLLCEEYDPEAMDGFLTGLGKVGRPIGLGAVPWSHWGRPLSRWLPMIVLTAIACTCMGLVVHRQWSHRERLRYPIAEFATSLIQREPGRAWGGMFRLRLFWIGLAIVLSIRVVNGLHRWFPDRMIEIPLTFNFWPIAERWPVLARTPWGNGWMTPTVYPIVIAFSFFLASEISLSLGLTQILFVLIASVLVSRGVNMSSSYMAGGAMGWHRCGAYAAFALMLLYVGRRYYTDLLVQSLTLRRRSGVEPYEARACRLLLISLAALVGLIVSTGLQWPLALAFVALMMLMFVGVARISAETGLFFVQSRWTPMGAILGLLGGYALGPEGIILLGLLSAVLCLDPSMSLLPYLTNALKVCDNLKVRVGRAGLGTVGTYLVGLAIAIPVVLWANYNFGIGRYDWSYKRVPTMSFRPALTEIARLEQAGELGASESLSSLERIKPGNIHPKRIFLWAFGTGFALVLLVSFVRLRFAWWPLHPVIFLVWATWPVHCFFQSFLLGWLIKTLVARIGGHGTYNRLKPLMIGVVAGEVLGALVFMIVGAIYYASTGTLPVSYQFFPR